MSVARINARLLAGVQRAGRKTGNGPLTGSIVRKEGADDSVHPPINGSDVPYACTLIWDNFSAMARSADGVEADDVKALVPAESVSIVPTTDDKLTVAGETYKIMHVEVLNPGGVDILYTLQCRK